MVDFKMWFDLEFKWILCIFLIINALSAIWIYYDSRRFWPKVNPTAWAISCLLFSCLTLFFWWLRTGSHRSGLVFFMLLTVVIIVSGFNQEPIDKMLSAQISSTLLWAKNNINL
ncbi:MAG: hypothetical protein ABIG42_07570 [bacterium]